uniref:Putative ovule protein n=1 Tax=Solanum chacoense TaxID=4108 RepID=A0A0V0GTP9_SOLCH
MAFTLPTVKYSQGSEKVIRRLPALNGLTVKFGHAEHSPQLRSCDSSTSVWPSLTRSIPRKEAWVYHTINIPTVAMPT